MLIGAANVGWQSLSDLQYTTTEKWTINVNKLKFYLFLSVQQTLYHIVLASRERDRILGNQVAVEWNSKTHKKTHPPEATAGSVANTDGELY